MTSSISRRNPRAPTFGPLSTVRTTVNGVDFGMVRVPSGRFVDGEGPTRRELLVSRPFELGVAPVTQALWRAVMGWNASRSEGEDRPVEMVSWEDSQAFMAELERQGFPGFRLPTEAEWAWAARCGAPTRWVGADRPRAVAATVGVGQTVAVAGLPGSPVGAFDLSGNVREWVGDWHEGLGLSLAGVDLQGPASGRARVHRGGSWTGFARFARISFRDSNAPAVHGNSIGLRLSRTVQDQG